MINDNISITRCSELYKIFEDRLALYMNSCDREQMYIIYVLSFIT